MSRHKHWAGVKPVLHVIALVFLVLLLSACGTREPGPTPTPTLPPPTATPPPFAQAGHWETVGTAANRVSFDVTEAGEITNFNILIVGDCDVTVNDAIPIDSDNGFVVGPVDAEGKPVDNGIMGTFDTPTTANGAFDGSWDCPLSGGGVTTLFLPSEMATWSAEWQGP